MVSGSEYIFCFQDKNNNFYRPLPDGTVTIGPTPYFLKLSPAGWNEIAVQNIRNKKYWGIDRKISIPLAYVQDGALIVKHALYNLGIEADIHLVISRQQLHYVPGVEYGFWYKQIYRGEVDLSEFAHTGAKVTVTTLEDGLPKYLKSNEGTTNEYPMQVPEAVWVKMDGINLHEKINYQEISDFEVALNFYGSNFRLPTSYISSEGDSVGIISESQQIQATEGMAWADKITLDNKIFKNYNSFTVNVRMVGTMELKCTGMTSAPPYAFRARFVTSATDISDQNLYQIPFAVLSSGVYSTGAMVVGQTYTANYDITIPVPPNHQLFVEGIFFGGPGSNVKIEFTENSKGRADFITRNIPTYIRAFRGQYLFEKLINSITEAKYRAAASAYLAQFNDVVFTCGNALRGLDDALMKISFNDWWEFWDAMDAVCLIVKGGTVDQAKKQDMVDLNNFIDIGSPAQGSFKVSVAKDYLFNVLDYGYPPLINEVGVINGRQEFNTQFTASVGTTKKPATLNKISSKIIASCYQIEKLRITTFDKDSTDFKDDNTLFALHIESTLQPAVGDTPAHYKLNRALNPLVTAGLLEPDSVFNLFLTPGRNRDRNASFLHGCFYKGDTMTLFFKTAANNQDLVCDGLVEKANKNIGALAPAFFSPIRFGGDYPAPANLLDLIDNNPLQVCRFFIDGRYYFGIMEQTGITPTTNKTMGYELLSVAGNNLSHLIKYYGQ